MCITDHVPLITKSRTIRNFNTLKIYMMFKNNNLGIFLIVYILVPISKKHKIILDPLQNLSKNIN